MQSKTSFFNGTLFRKNLTRFWPLWGGASLLGALAPLALLMQLIQNHFQVELTSLEVTVAYYWVLTSVVPALCLIYAVLCALVVWSFLYNARSVGLMHTLPLNRRGVFVTNTLSGLAMLLIPFAAAGVLCVMVTAMAGAVAPAALLTTILCVLGECLFYFASATLVAFVTGHGAAMVVLYFVFHFLAVGLEYLLINLASGFYFGVSDVPAGVSKWFSPTMILFQEVSYYTEYRQVPIPGRDIFRSELSAVCLENAWIVALYALIGAGMLVLAWLLYRRRRSESAGDVVAVGWMKPVFRYGVALCAGLAGGMLLYSIFWSSYQDGSLYDILPMAVCMVLAGVLGYYIASMLLAKSLRIFRTTWKGAAGTAAAAAVLCGLVAADVLGMENRVPEAGEVNSVAVTIESTNGRIFDEAVLQRIIDAHRAVLAEKAEFLDNEDRAYTEDGWSKAMFQVYYQMKDGSTLSRHYYLDYAQEDLERPDRALGLLAALARDPDIQRANLLRDDIDRFTGGEVYCWDSGLRETVYVSFTAEQAEALYEAVGRDIDAGHFGKTAFRENAWYQEAYNGELSLYYQTKPTAESEAYSRNLTIRLSVYCTETVEALKDLGILDETHLLLTQEELEERNASTSVKAGTWEDYDAAAPENAEVILPQDAFVPADGPVEIYSAGVIG